MQSLVKMMCAHAVVGRFPREFPKSPNLMSGQIVQSLILLAHLNRSLYIR
jgi:hypothetical protein